MRRSLVNFRGHNIFAPKYPIFMTFARKINKIPEFYMIFARKMPEIYITMARKKTFFPIFLGGGGARAPLPIPPVSYAYGSIWASSKIHDENVHYDNTTEYSPVIVRRVQRAQR